MTSNLFTPVKLGNLTLHNKVVVAPMCQYSVTDGVVGDWHLMHVGSMAMGGHGLFIAEATAVEPRGRITPRCPGLWTDAQADAWKRVLEFCKAYGNVPMGVQLAHAGRKGSARPPWQGGDLAPQVEGGWQPIAPSSLAIHDKMAIPDEIAADEIPVLIEAFADAAKRAHDAGFDLVEIHGAHGYLIHQFLSPLSNQRTDAYGGSLENRMRFALEIYDAVRAAFPADKPVGMRISATDWADGGWDVQSSIQLAKALEAKGCDFLHVSSGGLTMAQQVPVGPGYQVKCAADIKAELTHMPVIAVGLIETAEQAETILASGQADLIALARPMLYNPHWTWAAARQLGDVAPYPRQYERAHPSLQNMPLPKEPFWEG